MRLALPINKKDLINNSLAKELVIMGLPLLAESKKVSMRDIGEQCTSLKYLTIRHAAILDIEEGMQMLRKDSLYGLNLSNNMILVLPENLYNFTNLRELRLDNNQMEINGSLGNKIFEKLHFLE